MFLPGGHQLNQGELEPELQRRLRNLQLGEQDQQGPHGMSPHSLHHTSHGQVSARRIVRRMEKLFLTLSKSPSISIF